jgi:hypothetical protein
MICRYCGEDIDPGDHFHEMECDGRQGRVEAELPQREPPVFDITAGRSLRDAAIGRVGRAAPDFQESALQAIYNAALVHREFITDEVWRRLDVTAIPTDNRGMGAAIMAAKRQGWIEPTTYFQQSAMRQNHARPCRVWRSKLRP